MNPIEELKKIAKDLEKTKKADKDDFEYVKLIYIDNERELEYYAEEMGWDSVDQMVAESGYSLSDFLNCYYVQDKDGDYLHLEWEELPTNIKPGLIQPIFIYAGKRVSHEKAKGFLTPDKRIAFVDADQYEEIST